MLIKYAFRVNFIFSTSIYIYLPKINEFFSSGAYTKKHVQKDTCGKVQTLDYRITTTLVTNMIQKVYTICSLPS